MMYRYDGKVNPCIRCDRVPDPEKCDNKRCLMWQRWFLERWKHIHGWYLENGKEYENGLEAGSRR